MRPALLIRLTLYFICSVVSIAVSIGMTYFHYRHGALWENIITGLIFFTVPFFFIVFIINEGVVFSKTMDSLTIFLRKKVGWTTSVILILLFLLAPGKKLNDDLMLNTAIGISVLLAIQLYYLLLKILRLERDV